MEIREFEWLERFGVCSIMTAYEIIGQNKRGYDYHVTPCFCFGSGDRI